MRGLLALRLSCNRRILLDMENFPTPRCHVLPWAANIATLLLMLAATWWSSAQRPPAVSPGLSAAGQAGPSSTAKQSPHHVLTLPAQDDPKASQASWPGKTTSLPSDGIITVVYTPVLRH